MIDFLTSLPSWACDTSIIALVLAPGLAALLQWIEEGL